VSRTIETEINKLMKISNVQFGTSGVRGLVTDMTDKICWAYVTGFLQYLKEKKLVENGSEVGIAGDLRSSSQRIMNAAARAVLDCGLKPINFGKIPSPAISLYGLHRSIPTIMVTGSHIPDDRNGIKFNTPHGEILKADELAIKNQIVMIDDTVFSDKYGLLNEPVLPEKNDSAAQHYIDRFVQFFPRNCLQTKRIGLYEHSSVSRSCLKIILQQLGAEVISLGRSDVFVAVDTEAIRPEDVILAKIWCKGKGFDCIISTDGDGDRPLISDESGNWLRGDVAGILCAKYLGIDTIVTPVSSNTSVEFSNLFKQVIRTKIGSPYVIEAMNNVDDAKIKNIAGYEANGGFLQQTDISLGHKILTALPTRDATIVPLSILMLTINEKTTVSGLIKKLPQRFTYSDRLKNFPTSRSKEIIADMLANDNSINLAKVSNLFESLGKAVDIDQTDGIRITFENDEIVHLRPSGNAPEFRCYNEADTEQRVVSLNQACIATIASWRER
jgi:phosphomannomutase